MSIKQYSITNSAANTFMLSSLLLAGFTSQTLPDLSINSTIECYKTQRDGSWKYLEYIFMVQPANELKQASSKAQAFMAVAGALLLARTSIYNFINPQEKPAEQPVKDNTEIESALTCILKDLKKSKTSKENAFDLAGHLAGLVISGVAYQTYCGYIESTIRMNTMIKFLENWSAHRNNVPEELVATFDEVAAYYNAHDNSITDEQLNAMLEIIQHLIEHSFEKRYPKAKDVDFLGTFKTFTDIGKNLKG